MTGQGRFLYKRAPMANTKSAKEIIRKIARRTDRNRKLRSRIRTFIKKVDAAIATGDHKASMEALKKAQSEIMTGVSKGVYKQETASRKISRLNARIKKLAGDKKKAA